MRIVMALCALLMSAAAMANSAPVVSNVAASQRLDDSKVIDVFYDLADADGDACTVWILATFDNGANWHIAWNSITGDHGNNVAPGLGNHIVWDASKDFPGLTGPCKVRVYADDNKAGADMVLVQGGFYQGTMVPTFMIDKYEVTNAQYCEFLNETGQDGDNWNINLEISQLSVMGSYYYKVKANMDNYPVRYVSRNNANAFANWKKTKTGLNYKLPSRNQWEKAAYWNPIDLKKWNYGYQSDTIDYNSMNTSDQYGGTLQVGSFNGTNGKNDAKSYYGCYDMSGNISEFTSDYNRTLGGDYGTLSLFTFSTDNYTYPNTGFRLVIDFE